MSYVAPTGSTSGAPGSNGLFGLNLTTPTLTVPLSSTISVPAGAQGVGYETTLPSEESVAYMFRWLLAWMVVLLVLWLLNKTSIGHVTIYYLLLLALVFLVVTQYKWFANALAPLTGTLIVPTPQAAPSIPPAGSAVGGINQG